MNHVTAPRLESFRFWNGRYRLWACMSKRTATAFFSFIVFAILVSPAGATDKPEPPYTNPYLAASTYPIAHMRGAYTPLAGPTGPSRRLRANEITHKPVGPLNAWLNVYSGPYPNGKRVIWIGGYDRVAKLDADTLETLSTYAFGGTYLSNDEVRRDIESMDRLDASKPNDQGMTGYALKMWAGAERRIESVYRMVSKDNELYMPFRADDGSIGLRVFGETDANDPASAIVLRREWKIPATVTTQPLMSVTMTSDGWIAMATKDGMVIVLARDFSAYHTIRLPRKQEEQTEQSFWTAFVRNGIVTDDHGGIYIPTRDYLDRVQWTGSNLSLDEADGGWSVPYPNERGIGSGTTPALMGWGPKEDRLVLIADGSRNNNLMALWRDKIPDDWKGLPGFDRRVAAVTPVRFDVTANEEIQIEDTPVVYGYGAFLINTFPVQRLPDQGKGPLAQWFIETYLLGTPGREALGGSMIRWNPQSRTLATTWNAQRSFAGGVCTVSGANELIYCWGSRNGEWTLEGTDWHSGKVDFVYTLGKSQRFNPLGGTIEIAPNGAVDCGCAGGFGMVRVHPKAARAASKK